MSTADLVKTLCKEKKISLAELSRRMGQTPQNLSKKLKRDTLTTEELLLIARVLDVKFEQPYSLPDGKKIGIYS